MKTSRRTDEPGLVIDSVESKARETVREELTRAFRWLVVYPAGAFVVLLVVVGTIAELMFRFNAERLEHPVAVKQIGPKTLRLADGREVKLRFLKRLPGNDPVFLEAIKGGVEIDGRGEAYGLLTLSANCGMTWEPRHVTKVNLRDLVASAHPECIDESSLPREQFADLKEFKSHPYKIPGRLWTYPLLQYCRSWHEAFEAAENRSLKRGL